MASPEIRRKLTLTVAGRKVVLIKNRQESLDHVLGKAILLEIYGRQFPETQVEVGLSDRYKPDLLAVDERGEPRFWGEVGQVKKKKIEQLLKRYPGTSFAFARHRLDPKGFEEILRTAAGKVVHRNNRFVDLVGLPEEKEPLFTEQGSVALQEGSYTRVRLVGT